MKEEIQIEKQEKPTMNLLTNFDDTLQAMAEIEGYDWLVKELRLIEKKKNNNNGDYYQCLAGALEYLKKIREDIEEETDPEEKKYSLDNFKDKIFVVYGSGGWNRWFVNGFGEVKYSKYHAPAGVDNSALFKKIEALGFELEF
jgi:hypothetical protein